MKKYFKLLGEFFGEYKIPVVCYSLLFVLLFSLKYMDMPSDDLNKDQKAVLQGHGISEMQCIPVGERLYRCENNEALCYAYCNGGISCKFKGEKW